MRRKRQSTGESEEEKAENGREWGGKGKGQERVKRKRQWTGESEEEKAVDRRE